MIENRDFFSDKAIVYKELCGLRGIRMKIYSQEEARHALCRYRNLDGAEPLCGRAGVEKNTDFL